VQPVTMGASATRPARSGAKACNSMPITTHCSKPSSVCRSRRK
jgi:hypothetical protein